MSRQRALDNLCGKIYHNSHLTSIEIRGRASRTRKFEMCDLFLNDTLLLNEAEKPQSTNKKIIN